MLRSRFSHIALLVSSVEASARWLKDRGINCGEPESFESEGTKEIYVGSYAEQAGLLLLLEAVSDGPYKRALSKRGPGLHHIAIDVLNIETFLSQAQASGWTLHAESEHTMKYKTAWLFRKGLPTLIEVHQTKELSKKSKKVSKIELSLTKENLSFFKDIGLGELVFEGRELYLTVDNQRMSFAQLACLK